MVQQIALAIMYFLCDALLNNLQLIELKVHFYFAENCVYLIWQQLELVYVAGENGEDIGLQNVQCATVFERHSVRRSVSEPDDTGDDADADATGSEEPDSAPDNQTLIRLLEEQEKVRQ